MSSSTDHRKATEDLLRCIQSVFQRSSRGAREKAWERITSSKGKADIKTLIANPSRSISQFRDLITFKEWLDVT